MLPEMSKINFKDSIFYKAFKFLNNTDFKVFLLSLVIAAFIWTVMKLSDVNTYSYSITLDYSNYPDGLVLANEPDSVIQLKFTSKGFKLISSALKRNEKIKVDLSKLNFKPDKDSISFKSNVTPAFFKSDILNQLEAKKIGEISSPDSIYFVFAKYIDKKVAVKVNSKLSFKEDFKLYGKIVAQPDSVLLSGPKNILDDIDEIQTKQLIINNLKSNIEKTVYLEIPKGVKSSKESVTVNIEVASCTQMERKVKLNLINKVNSVQIKTFPSYVNVKYQIAIRDNHKISDTSFEVSAVLDSMRLLHGDNLIPFVSKKPGFVKNVRISEESIDYIILEE